MLRGKGHSYHLLPVFPLPCLASPPPYPARPLPQVGGQTIREGEGIIALNQSANRCAGPAVWSQCARHQCYCCKHGCAAHAQGMGITAPLASLSVCSRVRGIEGPQRINVHQFLGLGCEWGVCSCGTGAGGTWM